MRAVAMLDHKLHLRELPVPVPGPGEVLVKTLACGICGSDLHALRHTEKLVESARRAGGAFVMDTKRDVVMGHEFCAEIADYGPGTPKRFAPGTRVCAMPILVQATGVSTVGYSNDAPGGYGEYMRLMEPLLLPVPASLSTDHAALTEPMAVGLHAVKKAKLERDDVPLVIGCGPVGLAVIAALRLEAARSPWRWAPTPSSTPRRAHPTRHGAAWPRGVTRRRRRPCRRGCPAPRSAPL